MSTYTNLYIAVLLYVVVVVTCYETFSQEAKSDSLMEKFKAMVPEQASVIRDGSGAMKTISATELVIGDIIRLKSGDKIPADCRVISNQGMKVAIRSIKFVSPLLTAVLLLGRPIDDNRRKRSD